MGPSGSGKSTLMHCMAGLDTLTTGKVFIDGEDITAMSDRERTLLRRDKLGFVRHIPAVRVDSRPKPPEIERARAARRFMASPHRPTERSWPRVGECPHLVGGQGQWCLRVSG
ncbi:MAG: ATP-binding cassette domain-containing protein [Acidimicrobiaceae bacterium]|nr:ATP-binding cassette domain-containing protein [Acidimicrobiaceae bacterium]